MDRARAVRLALKCMSFIENEAWSFKAKPEKTRRAPPGSAAVITIQGSSIHLTPVMDMIARSDMKNRRPTDSWWHDFPALVEQMGSKGYFESHDVK